MLRLVEFTKEVLAQKRVRLIGVCFGHQIVGRALGAPVARTEKGFELSVIELDLTARGKELFDGNDNLVRRSLPPFLTVLLNFFILGDTNLKSLGFPIIALDFQGKGLRGNDLI